MTAHSRIKEALHTQIAYPMGLELFISAASVGERDIDNKSYVALWTLFDSTSSRAFKDIAIPTDNLNKGSILAVLESGIIAQAMLIDRNFHGVRNWDGASTYPLSKDDYKAMRSRANAMPVDGPFFTITLNNILTYLNSVFAFTNIQIVQSNEGFLQVANPQGVFAEVDYSNGDTIGSITQALIQAIALR